MASVKRIAVIGRPGSGKSHLARQLARVTGLPLVHLDKAYHSLAHRSQRSGLSTDEFKQAWRRRVAAIVAEDEWITDGNYGSNFDVRLPRADLVILLDYRIYVSLRRLAKRRLMYGKPSSRPDMPRGWEERFNLPFYKHHVFGFKKKHWYNEMLQLIEEIQPATKVVVLRSPRQADRYLRAYAHSAPTR